jgi:hypothetical protein
VAAAQSRHSNFWARRVSFFLLPLRRSSGQFSSAMDISGVDIRVIRWSLYHFLEVVFDFDFDSPVYQKTV